MSKYWVDSCCLLKVNNIPCYKVMKNKFFLTNDFKFIYVFIAELLSAVVFAFNLPPPLGTPSWSRGRVFIVTIYIEFSRMSNCMGGYIGLPLQPIKKLARESILARVGDLFEIPPCVGMTKSKHYFTYTFLPPMM